MPETDKPEIEYFYSAHSSFAYLGSAELMALAGRVGRRIVHRPMDLNRVLKERGSPAFAERDRDYVRYHFRREIWRWAEFRGVPIMDRRPSHHDKDYNLANRVLIASIEAGADTDRLAHSFLAGHWNEDADLSDPETLVGLAARAGCDGAALLQAAGRESVAATYEANTAAAIAARMFGSPTYVVDGDLFYGQDHLVLVERACRQPFGPSPD